MLSPLWYTIKFNAVCLEKAIDLPEFAAVMKSQMHGLHVVRHRRVNIQADKTWGSTGPQTKQRSY